MDMQSAIRAVTEGRDLSAGEMQAVMRTIMGGEATPAQIGGFLVALRMKGETIEEIAAAAGVMRELATRVEVSVPNLVDTCGTGGDSLCTFNISTASAFVVAAAGGHVAKHGNRSVYSNSGSADVLEAAGVRIDLAAEQVGRCITEVGVGFMFAPLHHGATRHAVGPRKEMGVRTMFNLLGPLTNPAGTPYQMMGVFRRDLIEPLAHVLGRLGSQHVLVVHSEEGMDEISIGGRTHVAELRNGEVRVYDISPADFDVPTAGIDELVVGSADESLAMIRRALANESGPTRDVVALNAGAAIYAADLVPSLEAGVREAQRVLANGDAMARLEHLVRFAREV